MAEGGKFARCPYCDRVLDTDASDAVFAVKQQDLQGVGGPPDFADESGGAFFHPRCPPEVVGYVRRPRPGKSDCE